MNKVFMAECVVFKKIGCDEIQGIIIANSKTIALELILEQYPDTHSTNWNLIEIDMKKEQVVETFIL